MTAADVTAPRACPVCGGARLYGLTFDHWPTGCALRDADDATVAADYQRLAWVNPYDGLTRPATAAEQTLATALGWPGPTATFGQLTPTPTVWTIVTPVTAAVTSRRLRTGDTGDVWDPNAIGTTP